MPTSQSFINPYSQGNFIDPNSIPDFSSMLQSYANNNLPSRGGPQGGSSGPSTFGALASGDPAGSFLGIDPIASFIGNLFGGSDKPSFKPYVNSQGQYVYTNPNTRNPVPVASVPGAPLKPGKNYKNTAGNVQAIQDLLPYLSQAINQTIAPNSVAQLQASQLTSPGYAQLMTQLYNNYGPALNQIGNTIQNTNALAQAGTTNNVLSGPGAQTVQGALALQQQVDPQYFAARQQGLDQFSKLFSSIAPQLQGQLTPTEMNQIAQGNARNNAMNGTLGSPSATNTIANAMNYGTAGTARQQQGISNLSSALSNLNSFMPMSKSGIDAFQTATGRSSQANPGQSNMGNGQFTGINPTGGNSGSAFGLAGQMFGGLNSLTAQQMAQSFQQQQNSFGTQFMSNLGGSLGQLPSKLIGMAGSAFL